MRCIGCGTDLIAGLWIDRAYLGAHDDGRTVPYRPVCAVCAAGQGRVLDVRLSHPMPVPPNMAFLLVLGYAGKVRRIGRRRAASARAAYWHPTRRPIRRRSAT